MTETLPRSAIAHEREEEILRASETMNCPISNCPMEFAFKATVLGKFDVRYYYSNESGLLAAETPYWLDEAYQEAISDTDTGIVQRNTSNSRMLDVVLRCLSLDDGRLLDVAGGYGLLTRMMRDKGYDCYTTDKYCRNLFAKAFEPARDFQADALLAFEVLEHVADPRLFLESTFERFRCRTLIFSTLTFEKQIPSTDWWYYSFESGQHVSFYQPRTLALLASQLGCRYYPVSPFIHVFTDKSLSGFERLLLSNKYLRSLYAPYARTRRRFIASSKTWDDHVTMRNALRRQRTSHDSSSC